MPHRAVIIVTTLLTVLWSSVLPQPSPVLAHEHREVGNYLLVVGWADEPPLVGEKNALTLRVTEQMSERPVLGLEQTLRVEVQAGNQKRELALDPVFRQPGQYEARVIPTRPGDYQFRFLGSVEALEVDVLFDSREGGFEGAQSAQGLQFPDAIPSVALINRTVQEAEQRALTAESQASRAAQDAQVAQALAVGALGIGVLGLLVGAVALVRSRQSRQAVAVDEIKAQQAPHR